MAAGAVIGIDPGEKRIGVAIAGKGMGLAVPLTVVETVGGDAVKQIVDIIELHGVSQIVVGLPKNMDATEGGSAERARAFAQELVQATNLPVALIDERLTTVGAAKALRSSEGRKAKGALDQLAATFILQSYLDAQR